MRPRLNEDPREWRKFAGASLAAFWLMVAWLRHRGTVSLHSLEAAAVISLVILAVAGFRPRGIRPVYRVVMTVGFCIGQGVGRLLLALAFILIVLPLGVALRLAGKDLLRLRKGPSNSSYWQPARPDSAFDRQF